MIPGIAKETEEVEEVVEVRVLLSFTAKDGV